MGSTDTGRWSLHEGDAAPVQGPNACGSAALVVARMLVDPRMARWVTTGARAGAGPADGTSEQQRFASCERAVSGRTNALWAGGGRLNLPWPRSLGTPPLGALAELEHGAARPGARYRLDVLRWSREEELRSGFAGLVAGLAADLPALLYVGNRVLPRHCVLLMPGGAGRLMVYDPARGSVTVLTTDRYADRRLALSGWHVPWLVLRPRGRLD